MLRIQKDVYLAVLQTPFFYLKPPKEVSCFLVTRYIFAILSNICISSNFKPSEVTECFRHFYYGTNKVKYSWYSLFSAAQPQIFVFHVDLFSCHSNFPFTPHEMFSLIHPQFLYDKLSNIQYSFDTDIILHSKSQYSIRISFIKTVQTRYINSNWIFFILFYFIFWYPPRIRFLTPEWAQIGALVSLNKQPVVGRWVSRQKIKKERKTFPFRFVGKMINIVANCWKSQFGYLEKAVLKLCLSATTD